MKSLLNVTVVGLSVVLYVLTPMDYDLFFCTACMALFFIVAIDLVRNDIKQIGWLNFNILFLFTFFACTYVFPVFLIGGRSLIGDYIQNSISSFATINKGVSLSTFAISIYAFFYKFCRNDSRIALHINEIRETSIIYKNSKIFVVIVCLLIIYVLYSFMQKTHGVEIEVTDAPYLFQLFYYIVPIYLVSSAIHAKNESIKMKRFFKNNIMIIILLVAMMALFTYIGDRAPIITIGITIIAAISLYVKRIKPKTLLLYGLLGIILMFSLRMTRNDTTSLRSGGIGSFVRSSQQSINKSSGWDLLSDLVGISFELNEGMMYVESHGFLYPSANMIIFVTSPIPFLPTYLTQVLYDKTPEDVTPGPTIARYTRTHAGNHCVIDIYMPFGFLGVALFFSLLGVMVAKITNGLNKNNLFCKIFYVYLLSAAIFVARNSLTNLYRSLVLTFVIYYILVFINNRKRTV